MSASMVQARTAHRPRALRKLVRMGVIRGRGGVGHMNELEKQRGRSTRGPCRKRAVEGRDAGMGWGRAQTGTLFCPQLEAVWSRCRGDTEMDLYAEA